ncbi:MAG TPA: hypothetical protein ENK05_03400 [Gammaproteobacteria bacterium]|nr:hypothetical protein [Gammaproteobacteria bacterium]
MTRLQSTQAEAAVQHFRELLGEEQARAIGARHFDKLHLIIESAIDAAVMEEINRYAGELEDIVKRMKRSSERFDNSVAAAED